ncbi:MAG: hypothetical protein JJU28_20910 [Cyclobacteriaceae bacterium]|nr:hypothetical protein [Cyclobacteriaceae bacterium]
MENIKFPVVITTLIVLIYHISPFIGATYTWILFLFTLSTVAYFWMVYIILVKGKPSGHTFEDKWYDDQEKQH